MTPKRRIIPIFVPHAGCPHDCVFCNQRRISGSLTPATAQTVHEVVGEAKKTLPDGMKAEIAFYGGSFTAIPVHEQQALLSAAYEYILDGTADSVRLSTRPDCVGEEDVERLLRFGVKTVELGVQSMDEEVLLLSGRGHTANDAEKAFKLLRAAGFEVILQMMTGLPGDTPERSLETARRIAALKPDGVRVYPTVIVRDTALYDMWRRGEYAEHTVEQAASVCAHIMDIFEEADIPVIRLGLNPSDELSDGAAAAGAYHPAFGEIVQSLRYLEKERTALSACGCSGGDVVFGVARGQVSAAVGQRKTNVSKLTLEFGLRSVKFRETDVKKGDITVLEIAKH